MPKTHYLFKKDHWLSAEKKYWWKFSDEIVYELFERRNIKAPQIKNFVRSKVILLGRYYLTGIERKAQNIKVTDAILKAGFEFGDTSLDSTSFNDKINIYEPHAKLAKAIKKVTGTWEAVFASKWLHFHQKNSFPIIDSISEKALFKHKYVRDHSGQWIKDYEKFHNYLKKDKSDYDDRYCWFCYCLLKFREHIARELKIRAESITVKQLDVYLFTLHTK